MDAEHIPTAGNCDHARDDAAAARSASLLSDGQYAVQTLLGCHGLSALPPARTALDLDLQGAPRAAGRAGDRAPASAGGCCPMKGTGRAVIPFEVGEEIGKIKKG